MSKRIILNFEHMPSGKNCMTSALWKLLHHEGYDISEEMLVGIASGLGFIYWKMRQMETPFVGGMNGGKFPTILGLAIDRLGGSWKVLASSSIERAHKQLSETLELNQPALVCVDLGYLNYLSLGGDDHFGMHTILVYGFDEEKNEAYISDRFATTIIIPLDDLKKARASSYHPFPAKNKLMQVFIPEVPVPVSEIIPLAIRGNADYMLNPPISNMGARGIIRWKDELRRYPKSLGSNKIIAHALIEHFVYIEVGGSGGALFRRMYTRFLKEASREMKDSNLLRASKLYNTISDLWSKTAIMLTPDELPALSQIRKIHVQNNHDLEQKGVTVLDSVKRRLKEIPLLLQQAYDEVNDFEGIYIGVEPLLNELYLKETEAAQHLALWADGL